MKFKHAIATSLMLATFTTNAAELITEDDPLVGTWVGLSAANPSEKNFGDLAIFACWVTGGHPSGICHGASRMAGVPSELKLGTSFPVWIENVSGNWYEVSFTSAFGRIKHPLILDRGGNNLTTALLSYNAGAQHAEGYMEVSSYFRASDDLSVDEIADYYLQ